MDALLGTWKLVSYAIELQASGERRATLGRNPTGYLVFGADRRMMAVITGDERKAGEADAERAALLRTMVAYTGDRLEITSAWQPSTVLPGRPVTRGYINWQRA